MKTPKTTRKRNPAVGLAVLGLCFQLPAVIGGCPDLRAEYNVAFETAARGVFDAGLDLLFDQLRSDQIR